jgi:phosphohistidine phosphatase
MNVYLVRHADALAAGTQGILADADRPLSPDGQRQVTQLAAWLKHLHVRLDKVLTSPLVRARQTAEGLTQHLQLPPAALECCDYLQPGGPAKKLAKFLRELDSPEVALVGHEPDLSQHAAWLMGSKKARLEFAKGGAACIACDEPPRKGAGILRWLVSLECVAS